MKQVLLGFASLFILLNLGIYYYGGYWNNSEGLLCPVIEECKKCEVEECEPCAIVAECKPCEENNNICKPCVVQECPPCADCPPCIIQQCPTTNTSTTTLENVAIAAYLGERVDQQHHFNVGVDDFKYLSRYYNSVLKLGIKVIIFHDSKLSQEFTKKYTTDKISFHRVNLSEPIYNNIGVYNLRFEIFYRYLANTPYNYVMLTDLTDVNYKANVFDWMEATKEYYDLYIGSEDAAPKSWPWQWAGEQIEGCYGKLAREKLVGPIMYNIGIIGGRYERVLALLTRLRELLFEAGADKLCDTAALYKILFNETDLTRVNTGWPLHTSFRPQGPPDTRFSYISHK